MRSSLALALVVTVATVGCDKGTGNGGGNTDGGTGLEGLTVITVSPPNLTLTVSDTAGAAQDYTASGMFQDGHSEDITSKVTFSSAAPIGQFMNGAHFTSAAGIGGATSITAQAGTLVGSTALNLLLKASENDPGSTNLPGNPSASFGGPASTATGADLPLLVYPADEVLVPPNLGKLEIHFEPGTGNKLFELSFSNTVTNITVYLRCTSPPPPEGGGAANPGCVYQPDPKVWAWIAETNRGTDPVSIGLRATDDSTNGGAVASATVKTRLSFSQDDIEGGIYYWRIATNQTDSSIMRFDFASTTQTAAEQFVGTEYSGGTCIGCHALSHDGSKLVAEAGGQGNNGILLMDVAKKMPIVPFDSTPKSFFESWNPDGTQFVGVDEGDDHNLRFYDGSTGAYLSNVPNTGADATPADHPDWSIDGTSIAYTKVGVKNTLQQFHKGAIEWVKQTSGAWSAPVELVAAETAKNYYYPAIAPDNAFLVYNRSLCSNGMDSGDDCNADTNATARLFGITLAAGAKPVDLLRANTGGVLDNGTVDLTNSFPKWSPFVFQRTAGERSSRLMWVTFASKRSFGVRSAPPSNRGGNGTLVWMAAIDPDQLVAGNDPSFPAFVLPFQDYATSNHIAQWTEKVVPVIQ